MDPITLVAAFALSVIGVARAVRLWTHDTWPPVVWLRLRVLNMLLRIPGDWTPLVECPFCVAPYVAAVSVGWAAASGLTGTAGLVWWLVHVWAAVSYLAPMLLVRDEG